jgi:hypothetical protein
MSIVAVSSSMNPDSTTKKALHIVKKAAEQRLEDLGCSLVHVIRGMGKSL